MLDARGELPVVEALVPADEKVGVVGRGREWLAEPEVAGDAAEIAAAVAVVLCLKVEADCSPPLCCRSRPSSVRVAVVASTRNRVRATGQPAGGSEALQVLVQAHLQCRLAVAEQVVRELRSSASCPCSSDSSLPGR